MSHNSENNFGHISEVLFTAMQESHGTSELINIMRRIGDELDSQRINEGEPLEIDVCGILEQLRNIQTPWFFKPVKEALIQQIRKLPVPLVSCSDRMRTAVATTLGRNCLLEVVDNFTDHRAHAVPDPITPDMVTVRDARFNEDVLALRGKKWYIIHTERSVILATSPVKPEAKSKLWTHTLTTASGVAAICLFRWLIAVRSMVEIRTTKALFNLTSRSTAFNHLTHDYVDVPDLASANVTGPPHLTLRYPSGFVASIVGEQHYYHGYTTEYTLRGSCSLAVLDRHIREVTNLVFDEHGQALQPLTPGWSELH